MKYLLNQIKKSRSPEHIIVDMLDEGLRKYNRGDNSDIYHKNGIILFIHFKDDYEFNYNLEYFEELFNTKPLDFKTKQLIYDIIKRYKKELNIGNAIVGGTYFGNYITSKIKQLSEKHD